MRRGRLMAMPSERGWYVARNAHGVFRIVFLVPGTRHVYLMDSSEPCSADSWSDWQPQVEALLDHEHAPAEPGAGAERTVAPPGAGLGA
jgi:hypothetical protein